MKYGLRYWLLRHKARREGLFLYWDGTAWRLGDPVQLLRRVMALEAKEEALSRGMDNIFQDLGEEALEKLAEVFEVKRFDGRRGLTDVQFIRLVRDLMDWLGDQKKSGIPGLDSQPLSEGPFSSFQAAPASTEPP